MAPRPGLVAAAYAGGTAGLTALIAASSFFLVFFLTDVALLPPALAGNALLVGKLWDTVNDPLLGVALDRTRRRVPLRRWLWLGAVPLGFATVGIWWVPQDLSQLGRLAWVTGAYLVFDTLFTVVHLAFTALGAEATTHYDGRTRLMAFGAAGAIIGYLLGASGIRVAKHFFPVPATAYLVAGVVMGAAVMFGTLLAARGLVEPPLAAAPEVSQPRPAWRDALWVLRQRPFALLVGATVCARLGFTLVSAALPYFAKYYLDDEAFAASLVVGLMVVVGAMVPGWRRLADRWSKAKAYALSLGVVAAGLAATWVLPRGGKAGAFALVALVGVGMAGHWVLPWAILPDVVDWDHAHTGQRRIGLYLGVYGLADKLARTAGVVSLGWVLSLAGYTANAEQGALALGAIRASFGPGPALVLAAAVPLLLFFPIGRAEHEALRQRLAGAQPSLAPGPTPSR